MGNESNAVPVNVTPIDILPEPLKRVRELAKSHLAIIFGNMFDSADDALFELADKATSNIDQTMYFDSMRQVRIQRQSMESLFMQGVQESFRLLYAQGAEEPAPLEEQEADSLALVQDDELEESVAIRGMVSKVKSRCEKSLEELTSRVDHLVRIKTITEASNPIGPQAICEAFRKSADALELDIRAKLVVYKLFEKYVLAVVDELYSEANKLLVDKGVLPKIDKLSKSGVSPRNSAPNQATPIHNATGAQPPQAGSSSVVSGSSREYEEREIFNFLRGLLSESQTQRDNVPSAIPVVEQSPALDHSDLVQLLSSIQHQSYDPQDYDHRNVAKLPTQQLDVRAALFDLLEKSGQTQEQKSIGRVDDDVINLVSMLFEFILDDHNLATPMKALLARLQIPLLKVAVLDKGFFSRGGHPARKLLNELATAAVGWSEPADLTRDKLYLKFKSTVEQVLNDFVDDVSIFQYLLDDFTAFISGERRRAELIEQRTRDAEEGLGKTQYARSIVGEILNKKAKGIQLPSVVVELLRDGWANYMFLTHVREGAESDQWNNALTTVDDLIWSVQPVPGKAHTAELLKLIPSLLQRLRNGLTSISFSKTKMRAQFKELEGIHLDCLRSRSPGPTEVEDSELGAQAPQSFQADTDSADSLEADAEVSNRSAIDSPIIIEEPAPPSEPEQSAGDDSSDEHLKLVDAMGSGTWVEMLRDDKKQRAKLAAIIRATGKYIFVNRVGMKVAERSRLELAQELREGVISILDDTLLFDRALESVIGHLREMKD